MPTLHWIGKEKVINHHQDVPFRVLEEQYTYGSETSENKIIHGDNLEALKALLPEYEGKIKCIYIDPPYNTGNEGWVYNDKVNDPKIKKWLGEVVGKESEDLSRHDKWLCMMYPRLKLLHKLLAEDGVIFISIDDNEQANLKLICDEIFDRKNFVTSAIWKKKNGGGNDSKFLAVEHEYVLIYVKSDLKQAKWFTPYTDKYLSRYKEEDSAGKYYWDTFMRTSGKQYYPIECPDGTVLEYDNDGNKLSWLRSEKRFKEDYQNGDIRIVKVKNQWTVHFKQYLSEGKKPRSFLSDISNNSKAKQEVQHIFDEIKVFDYPKPVDLIQYLISIITKKNDIILDSFAGSGTTAHAVLNLNKQDGGNRKFILIEMEDYAESITAERVKRVINGYGDEKKRVDGTGGDFSYYCLGDSIFNLDGTINKEVSISEIRKYIYFMETKQNVVENPVMPSFLGIHNDVSYYLCYNKNEDTVLDYDFLSTITEKTNEYVIYADVCLLSEQELDKYNITFKKMPRDIIKL